MATNRRQDRRILLGTITSAHGIRGEVLVRAYTAEADAIGRYGTLSDEAGARTFKIKSARATPKGVIVRIEGVGDRTAAEALRDVDLYVARAQLPDTHEQEYYHADLIGLEVRDGSGAPVGAVVDVANFGAGDLLEIRFEGERATVYIPFTDVYVPVVDVTGGFAVLVPPLYSDEEEPADDEVSDPQPKG